MNLSVGDKVAVVGEIIDKWGDQYLVRTPYHDYPYSHSDLIFIERPIKGVAISKDDLNNILHKWDYSQTKTVDDMWEYLVKEYRL